MKLKSCLIRIVVMFTMIALLSSSCDFLDGKLEDTNEPEETDNNPVTIGVAPLLQTKWGQGTPFNSMLTTIGGTSPVPGCDVIVAAQFMKYYRHPAQASFQNEAYTTHTSGINVPAVNFNGAYNWDNMLNTYTTENPGTEPQRNAVATLVYHIGVLRKKDFITGYTGPDALDYAALFTNIYGYDRGIQLHQRKFYTNAEWETIIRQQLDAGIPVFYWADNQTNTSPHTFILDGYDNTGRFHINMGWAGSHDGLYSLNAINPGNYNFNYEHNMYINIKPNAGSTGSNEFALNSFTASKTSVTKNESFSVSFRPVSLGYFSGGQLGTALVCNDGAIIEVSTRNTGVMVPGQGWRLNHDPIVLNGSVPNALNAGQYQLRIVSRIDNGDWKIVMLSDKENNVPAGINFEVR